MTSKSVLIIDDTQANLKLAQVVLLAAGFEVRTAANAEEGLQVLQSWKPRLILMDLRLPGMDGLECTRILKSNKDTSDIAVVALTSDAMKGVKETALEAGCDDFLTKPIDTRTMAEFLERVLANFERSHVHPHR